MEGGGGGEGTRTLTAERIDSLTLARRRGGRRAKRGKALQGGKVTGWVRSCYDHEAKRREVRQNKMKEGEMRDKAGHNEATS